MHNNFKSRVVIEKINTYNLTKLGPQFQFAKVDLYIYDSTNEEDLNKVSKVIKSAMPKDKHGVTNFDLWWEDMSNPTIRIFVDSAVDQQTRAFVTIPHEIEHAIGEIIDRAIKYKKRDIYPGCEDIALIVGGMTGNFQVSYLNKVGYVLERRA